MSGRSMSGRSGAGGAHSWHGSEDDYEDGLPQDPLERFDARWQAGGGRSMSGRSMSGRSMSGRDPAIEHRLALARDQQAGRQAGGGGQMRRLLRWLRRQ